MCVCGRANLLSGYIARVGGTNTGREKVYGEGMKFLGGNTRETPVRIVRTNNEEYIDAKSSADNTVSAVIQWRGYSFGQSFWGGEKERVQGFWNNNTSTASCFSFSFLFSFFLLIGLRLDVNFRGKKEFVWRIRREIENFTKSVQDHLAIQFDEAKSLLSRLRWEGSVKKNLISKENLLFK